MESVPGKGKGKAVAGEEGAEVFDLSVVSTEGKGKDAEEDEVLDEKELRKRERRRKEKGGEEEGGEEDLLELEFHPTYISSPQRRRRRWETRWDALIQAVRIHELVRDDIDVG